MFAKYIILNFVFSLNLVSVSLESFPQPIIYPQSCDDDEYFDTSRLSCQKCDDKNSQIKADDGLSCVCKPLHRQAYQKASGVTCIPCPAEQVVSLDGHSCVSCSPSSPYNATLKACSLCAKDAIRDEVITADGTTESQCISCPLSTWPDATGTRCIKCPDDFLTASGGRCICPKQEYSLVGGQCLPNSHLPLDDSSLFEIHYNNGETVRSAYFAKIRAVSYNCKVMKNVTACQLLGNMCVLLYYKMEDYRKPSMSDACAEYLKLTISSTVGRPIQWPSGAPWLYYLGDNAKTELFKTNVPNVYTTNSGYQTSHLSFLVARYDENGRFLSLSGLKPGELQLCEDTPESLEAGFHFGTLYEQKCKRSVQDLWNSSKLIFYDLYLNGTEEMYPVPVLVKDLKKNGKHVNQSPVIDSWQLVRRLFLTDAVSGIEEGSNTGVHPAAKVFRYAQHLIITITLQTGGNPGTIYPPLVMVKYAELTRQDYVENAQVTITFSIVYKMDQDKTHQDISVAMGVLCAIAALWAMFQTWSWARRSGKQAIDIVVIGKLLVLTCGQLANVFLLVMVCASLNWLVIMKKQDVLHTLLPLPSQEYSLKIYIGMAFVLKTFQLLHELFQISTVCIFFIDWERPRIRQPTGTRSGAFANAPQNKGGPVVTSNVNETSHSPGPDNPGNMTPGDATSTCKTTVSTSAAQPNRAGGKQTPDKQPSSELPSVSIWRTYFVANEWADIQFHRRVNEGLQLVLVLFFLKVIGFENLSLFNPFCNFTRMEFERHTPYSLSSRLALGALIYIGIAVAQIVLQKVFCERFFKDKLQQFVDLCSVSNVSVFILMTKRHGYYIHGRSAQGRADVNMKEMHELLRREEEDLCSRRGLLPNTEQQTFQMSLPLEVYDQYKRILLPLGLYRQAADRMQGVGGRLSRVDIDRVTHTYTMINKFLSGFIEHAFKDLDYVVKDKLPMETLLDVEFFDGNERGCFYNDTGHSFDAALFCGHELTFVTFEALLFSVIDFASQDFVLSAIITFCIIKLIQMVARGAARRNLVRKALVDERFLT